MTNDANEERRGDEDVRRAASEDLDTSFFLEAGAGTGKTKVLVDRVINIVRSRRATIDQVVVITFTEKAAGELRARIREDLHGVHADANASGEETAAVRRALDALDVAHIETIHAFASRLLREHPIEARVDPNFRQLNEVDEELDFEERWVSWLWSMEGAAYEAVQRCRALHMELATMRDVARAIAEYREVDSGRPVPTAPGAEAALRRAKATLDAARVSLQACVNRADSLASSFDHLDQQLVGLSTADPAKLDLLILDLPMRAVPTGRADYWRRDEQARGAVRAALESVSAEFEEFRDKLRSEAFGRLVTAMRTFVDDAALERRREGILTFGDLLIEARNLLRSSPTLRRELQGGYKFILVDEFQDTDPLQAEMVFLLAADESERSLTADHPWSSVVLDGGKLFVVGDPKQSIYRFRRADIEAYSGAREVFARSQEAGVRASIENIVRNFRSLPEVVRWVNETFAREIVPSPDYPLAQPDYQPIVETRAAAADARVIHLYPDEDLAGERMPSVRAAEADALARLIVEMIASTEWTVRERIHDGSEVERRVRLRDICMLVETRTAIDIYTNALTDRGIPFVLDGGKEFFQRQEILDTASVLRTLDDPSDQVSLVAALRSQAFCCSDQELLEFKVRGGKLSLTAPQNVHDGPVAEAIARLRDLYQEKAHHGLASFVDRVIRETALTEATLLTPEGRNRAANLRQVVDRAAEFASGDRDALRPFIRWISERQSEGRGATESQVHESEDDAVRITTIHSAKGLEFPIVILAKLAGAVPSGRTISVVNRGTNSVEFEVGDERARFRTHGFAAAWNKEQAYEEAENRRLMYVAATRACDYLVVPVFRPAEYPGNHRYLRAVPGWDSVRRQPPATHAGARVLTAAELPEASHSDPEHPVFPDDMAERWQRRESERHECMLAGPRFVAPSDLVADLPKLPRETEPKDRTERERDEGIFGEGDTSSSFAAGAEGASFVGATSARQRGSLVHEVLYRCDLGDPESASGWTARVCAERAAVHLETEVAEHARRILESAYMQRVISAESVLRELPVSWFDGHTYIEGFIDLAFEEADGWVVLDYKTDDVDGREDELVVRYAPQVAAYRNALAATGITIKEAGLWFTANGAIRVA